MMYDTLIIGQVCLDKNTDYDGTVVRSYGGAVLYSGCASDAMGNDVAVLVKRNPKSIDLADAYRVHPAIKTFAIDSPTSTRMENTYFTADRERRDCRCTERIPAYRPEELPDVQAKVFHLAGLIYGDIGDDMIEACAARGDVALDVQCMLRHALPDGHMRSEDWAEKKTYLPMIRYLKTDAAEAEILTGTTDRAEAARMLYDWGAKEIVITHNSEVLAYDGDRIYTCPIRARNLSGRTGRGDTTFAGYLGERLHCDIPTALLRATALVSLKMETPGPFTGTRADVDAYISQFYADQTE